MSMIYSGEGRYRVWLKVEIIGEDRLYILGGGENPHIGGMVVMEPGKEALILRLGNHYDYQVLQPLAEEACRKYEVTAAAVGGIHIDNASKEEIQIIVDNCKELMKCI
ncbi:MAG: hypothetical protein HXS44_04145 [Theionarchaea archaeon]|nr:hypothetical protein [Theionarchaea archaeon]